MKESWTKDCLWVSSIQCWWSMVLWWLVLLSLDFLSLAQTLQLTSRKSGPIAVQLQETTLETHLWWSTWLKLLEELSSPTNKSNNLQVSPLWSMKWMKFWMILREENLLELRLQEKKVENSSWIRLMTWILENLLKFKILSDSLMFPSSHQLEMFSSIKSLFKSGKELTLLLLDLMDVEKVLSSEFWVDFGPFQEEFLRGPALKNSSMCPKDLICLQEP